MPAPMTLDRHEQVLVILYRAAPIEIRRQIDRELFDAWTRHPCTLDSHAGETTRFRLLVQQLHDRHLVGKPLITFASYWTPSALMLPEAIDRSG